MPSHACMYLFLLWFQSMQYVGIQIAWQFQKSILACQKEVPTKSMKFDVAED